MTLINSEKLRARDEQALSELFKELIPTLRRTAGRYHAAIDPDEVVAEVLARLMRDTDRLADLANSGNLKAYCLHLTRNIALHHIRREVVQKRAAMELPLAGLTVEPEADEEYRKAELLQELKKALDRLSSTDRSLIEMCYLQEKPLDEVAQSLGVSKNALRVKLHRARLHLMNNLKLEGGTVR